MIFIKYEENNSFKTWFISALAILLLLLLVNTRLCSAQSLYTFFKSKDVLVRYGVPLFAEPKNDIELITDLTSIEIIMKNAPTNRDYLVNETKEFISFFKPAPDAFANKAISLIFHDGNPPKKASDVIKEVELEGMVFRSNGKGHLSLGVVSKTNSEIYIPQRLVSIAPTALKSIYDETTGKIDLDKITPNILASHRWPFSSSTDAIIFQDPKGFLIMKGKIEFIIDPVVAEMKGSFEITKLMRAEGGGFLNLGKGTKIKVQNLINPVELVDSNGKIQQVKHGNYVFSGEKWQEFKD